MPQISSGQSASLVLEPGESYTISATGVATVKGIYGAPATTTTLTANFQVFGPYGVPAKLDIACTSGSASYTLDQYEGDVVRSKSNPITGEIKVQGVATTEANTVVIFGDSLTAYNWARNAVASLTGTAGGYTATVGNPAHKLKVGDPFKISNAGDDAYNGNFLVSTVIDASNFTYQTRKPITQATDLSVQKFLHFPWLSSNAGYWAWADMLTGGRFKLLNNAGQSGEKLAHMLARIDDDVIAYKPARVVFLGGTNDIRTGTADPVFMFGIWRQIINKLRAQGITVTCLTVPTFGATEAQNTPAKIAATCEFNRLIREAVRNENGLELADVAAVFADPAATDGSSITAYFEDLIHFSPRGAYMIGKEVAVPLLNNSKPVNLLPSNPSDSYTFAGGGKQLLDNPLFQAGTGGTVSAPATGATAQSWRAEAFGSLTAVASLVARTRALDGDTYGNNARFVCTFAANNDAIQLRQSGLTSRVAAGDQIYAECALRLVNCPATLKRLSINVNVTADGVAYQATSGFGSISNTMPNEDISGGAVLRTPPLKIPADAVSITVCEVVIYMQTSGASGAGVELHIGRAALRKA